MDDLQVLKEAIIDEAFPAPSHGETEPKNMTAEERYEHRRAKLREGEATKAVKDKEKVVFADDGTLESWLTKIVELNSIDVVSRISTAQSK